MTVELSFENFVEGAQCQAAVTPHAPPRVDILESQLAVRLTM